ncbi:MAG TPA: glycosyltransferase family 4 protein [Methylotenera sp.]|nr:glycosyltransferase family 4 protein [Methylotenera sp.]
MRILLIHQNFPGQFRHLAGHLAKEPDYQVKALCQPQAPKLAGIETLEYQPARTPSPNTHHYNRPLEAHTLNGQAVVKELLKLKQSGFQPDIVVAHAAWGEALYVKDVFPQTKLIGFFEFYYKAFGTDSDFDPEFPLALDDVLRIRNKNTTHLLSLEAADIGICPTQFQKHTFPQEFQYKLNLIHEGINTELAKPNEKASYQLPNGVILTAADEVITYVSRNLEPYRGFHQFMRAVEIICQRRPNAQILIIGGDDISYGRKLAKGKTWRQIMLKELRIDESRVHFLGKVPYQQYLQALQISSAHIYLTVPFVLSWSMLEAMAIECAVIASNTSPVREVIKHDKNGLLVDFFSPTEIADVVDKLLDNPKKYQKMRQAARKIILDKYTIQQGIQQYIDLIG